MQNRISSFCLRKLCVLKRIAKTKRVSYNEGNWEGMHKDLGTKVELTLVPQWNPNVMSILFMKSTTIDARCALIGQNLKTYFKR